MDKEFDDFKQIEKWLCDGTNIEPVRRIELVIEIYRIIKEWENVQ